MSTLALSGADLERGAELYRASPDSRLVKLQTESYCCWADRQTVQDVQQSGFRSISWYRYSPAFRSQSLSDAILWARVSKIFCCILQLLHVWVVSVALAEWLQLSCSAPIPAVELHYSPAHLNSVCTSRSRIFTQFAFKKMWIFLWQEGPNFLVLQL